MNNVNNVNNIKFYKDPYAFVRNEHYKIDKKLSYSREISISSERHGLFEMMQDYKVETKEGERENGKKV